MVESSKDINPINNYECHEIRFIRANAVVKSIHNNLNDFLNAKVEGKIIRIFQIRNITNIKYSL